MAVTRSTLVERARYPQPPYRGAGQGGGSAFFYC